MVRRYRKAAPWGGRITEYGGRRIDRDPRTGRELREAEDREDAEYRAAMAEAAAHPIPTAHRCDDPRCSDCLPF